MSQTEQPEDLMQYEAMAQDALRGVVRAALKKAAEPGGLPEPHHLYITFKTKAVGVSADIAEYWQHDITYKVELPWDTTATLSVQNLLDKDPPFAIGTQYNYDPGSANPLGRVYSLGIKKRF